jgi:hypothetical protein
MNKGEEFIATVRSKQAVLFGKDSNTARTKKTQDNKINSLKTAVKKMIRKKCAITKTVTEKRVAFVL